MHGTAAACLAADDLVEMKETKKSAQDRWRVHLHRELTHRAADDAVPGPFFSVDKEMDE